jgi:hypothetical protein
MCFYFCRKLSFVQTNIITVLRSYFNEVANLIVILIGLSFIYTVAFGPLPSLLAQLVNWWTWTLTALLPALSLLLSGFQLAFVARFDIIFEANPVVLGRFVGLVAIVLTHLPNMLDYMITGSTGGLTVSVLDPSTELQSSSQDDTKATTAAVPFDFLAWHLVGWTVAAAVLFAISFFGIPIYLTLQGGFGTNHYSYFPRMTFKRGTIIVFALAILWNMNVLAANPDHGGHIPFFNFIFLFAVNLIFVFQLTDREVWHSVRQNCFFGLLNTAIVHPDVVPTNDIPLSVLDAAPHSARDLSTPANDGTGESATPGTQKSRLPSPYVFSLPVREDHLSLAVNKMFHEADPYEYSRSSQNYCRI